MFDTRLRCMLAILALLISSQMDGVAGSQMQITLGGYTNRTENLTNFPALVVFSNGMGGTYFDFGRYPFASANGYDLRFWDASETTPLKYEIEEWNSNGPGVVWVQVPLVASDGTTRIWAKWGDDASQLPCTTNGATWSEGYRAVWHMNGVGDSSTNAIGSTDHGSADAGGMISHARSFDGKANIAPPDGANLSVTQSMTVAAWLNTRTLYADDLWSFAYDDAFNDNGDTGPNHEYGMHGKRWVVNVRTPAANEMIVWQNPAWDPAPTGEWHHLVFVFDQDAAAGHIYVDGQRSETAESTGLAGPVRPSTRWRIGCKADNLEGFNWNGLIDELSVAGVARSSNWVWACWMSQASNGAFNTYGPLSRADLTGTVLLVQ